MISTDHWIFDSLWIFYLIHGSLSLLAAVIASQFVKRRFTNSQAMVIFLFLLFNISLPIVGYFFTIWIVYYLLHVKYEKTLTNVSYINMVEFKSEFPKVTRLFGEASMSELLANDFVPMSLKMKALVAMADNLTNHNLKLIKTRLSDNNDEIRLFSFAIVDKIEQRITGKMHTALKEFQETSDQETKIYLAEKIAQFYWEMIYFQLADEVLKKHILSEIKLYAQIVLDANLYHLKINILLGKAHLDIQEYDMALTYFMNAYQHNSETDFILPYIAEIYFYTKNYIGIKALLNTAETLRLNPTLYPIVKQWEVPA